jgi:hypothetical protein
VRFVAVVDMRGRIAGGDAGRGPAVGLREGDMKLVSDAFIASLILGERKRSGDNVLIKGTGVQGDADSIHKVIAKPILRPG